MPSGIVVRWTFDPEESAADQQRSRHVGLDEHIAMFVSEAIDESTAHTEAVRVQGVCWRESTPNDDIAEMAHALGHPVRIEIVRCLAAHGPLLSGEIVAGSQLAQSTVSEHLRILRKAGIVGVERDGSRVWNRLLATGVPEVIDALRTVAERRSSERA